MVCGDVAHELRAARLEKEGNVTGFLQSSPGGLSSHVIGVAVPVIALGEASRARCRHVDAGAR